MGAEPIVDVLLNVTGNGMHPDSGLALNAATGLQNTVMFCVEVSMSTPSVAISVTV